MIGSSRAGLTGSSGTGRLGQLLRLLLLFRRLFFCGGRASHGGQGGLLEDSDFGCPDRHGYGHGLLELLLRCAKLPCNCKAVLGSGLAPRGQGSPQCDQMLCLAAERTLRVDLVEKGLIPLKRLVDTFSSLEHLERGLLSGPYQHPLGVGRAVKPGFFDKLNFSKTRLFQDRQEILSR
jgi:hypothetical protein